MIFDLDLEKRIPEHVDRRKYQEWLRAQVHSEKQMSQPRPYFFGEIKVSTQGFVFNLFINLHEEKFPLESQNQVDLISLRNDIRMNYRRKKFPAVFSHLSPERDSVEPHSAEMKPYCYESIVSIYREQLLAIPSRLPVSLDKLAQDLNIEFVGDYCIHGDPGVIRRLIQQAIRHKVKQIIIRTIKKAIDDVIKNFLEKATPQQIKNLELLLRGLINPHQTSLSGGSLSQGEVKRQDNSSPAPAAHNLNR